MHDLDIVEIGVLLRSRDASPRELVRLMLDRIDTYDEELGSYEQVFRDQALRDAERLEAELARGDDRGPLHGVPIAVKALYAVAGVPTTASTPALHAPVATEDCVVVHRLREAGAIILGTNVMSEGALAAHHPSIGTPKNPWGEELWVGASSSGSAVATAAGLCYANLASDTGGSIRFPCAATGLTGLKTTWGRVPRTGTVEFAVSLDTFGPIARSARDCSVLYDVIAGPDAGDPTSLITPPELTATAHPPSNLAGVRIGVDEEFLGVCDAATITAIEGAISELQQLGAQPLPVHLPSVDQMIEDWTPACAVEAAVAHLATFPERRDEYGDQFAELLEAGNATSAVDHERLLRRRREFAAKLLTATSSVDVVVMQVTGIAGPQAAFLDEIGVGPQWRDLIMRATCPVNAAGLPALVLPVGSTGSGAPIGFQLVGPPLSEARLLSIGRAFQTLTAHHRRRPALPGGAVEVSR